MNFGWGIIFGLRTSLGMVPVRFRAFFDPCSGPAVLFLFFGWCMGTSTLLFTASNPKPF